MTCLYIRMQKCLPGIQPWWNIPRIVAAPANIEVQKNGRRCTVYPALEIKETQRAKVESRFWSKVYFIPFHECWEWGNALDRQGYGHLRVGKRSIKASRVSYALNKGLVPEGLVVRHTCDNPSCIRPEHLILGTIADNCQDNIERGRHPKALKTHCPRGHKYGSPRYVPSQDRYMRLCKECHRVGEAARRERLKAL